MGWNNSWKSIISKFNSFFTRGNYVYCTCIYTSAGIVVRLKAEDHTNPTRSVETEATSTSAGWNTLIFDMANEASGTAVINYGYTFNMLIFFMILEILVLVQYSILIVYILEPPAGTISGCTDPTATNYDSTATVDDGSCVYPPLNITVTVCDTSASSVRLTGPWWSWNPIGGP